MLQQTTVATVIAYFLKFIEIWPTIHDLATAEKEDVMTQWAGLGYYARARNLHKCAQTIANEYGGTFPNEQAQLKTLAGIGDYSSASIRAIAFDKPANVVDGNIERIMARLFDIHEPMPKSKKWLKELAGFLADDQAKRPGDYAQALMDIGATICTPKSPKCFVCPVHQFCRAYKNNTQAELPKKTKKAAKPQKFGRVYWVLNDKEEVLFIRRDENGMLGGMLGLPTSNWETDQNLIKPAFKHALDAKNHIKHSFTHFDLRLDIHTLTHQKIPIKPEKKHVWVSLSKIEELGLPTLFAKAVKLMK